MNLPKVHFADADGTLCGAVGPRFVAKLGADVPHTVPRCGACEIERRRQLYRRLVSLKDAEEAA